MGRHRQASRPTPRGRRVAPATRPRWSRLSAAGGSLVVTLVAILGGMGVLPTQPAEQAQAAIAPVRAPAPDPAPTRDTAALDSAEVDTPLDVPVPAASGTGRRIVFDMTQQRVWLVGGADDEVRRTYLVSGSVTDNLDPGTYSVYSKSEQAWGIDDSGTMKYMVRFARGDRAAIGFHDIPELGGAKVQTRALLGTPQSHGCIRQWRPDAKALWDFAPVGTKVVVVA